MGGGGGSDYSSQQAQAETEKQKARNALNAIFGVASTAPEKSQFITQSQAPSNTVGDFNRESGSTSDGTYSPNQNIFDQAGYDAVLAKNDSSVAGNKAGRDSIYQSIRDNTFSFGKRRLDENKDRAARDLKFTLFAQGLNGGSADVDENSLLGRTYGQGILDLGGKADAAKADAVGNDENTRLGLLQSIDNGMDQGSALSSALQQLQVNNDKAAASAQGTNIGDLFADAGLLYTKSQAARGKQQGAQDFAGNIYSPRSANRNASTGGITQY